MSDIHSVISQMPTHQVPHTVQKPQYRPRSSRQYKASASQHKTIKYEQGESKLERAVNNKKQIQPTRSNRKMFNSDKRLIYDEEVMSRMSSLRLADTAVKINRYSQDNPETRPSFNKHSSIDVNRQDLEVPAFFASRKRNEHKNREKYFIERKKQVKVKSNDVKDEHRLNERRMTVVAPYECLAVSKPNNKQNLLAAQKQKIIEKLSKAASSIRNDSIYKSNSRASSVGSRSQILQRQEQDLQDIADLTSEHAQLPAQEKLNHIIQTVGDTKLNNILWNDPAVQKILEQLKIYDEEQLDAYLSNNTEYFTNVFKNSPFGHFNLHYIRPPNTTYNTVFQEPNTTIDSETPIVNMDHYESLSKLHLQKGRIKQRLTTYQGQYQPKKAQIPKPILPETNLEIGHPQISNKTTYSMELPNRLDYDPTRIFKRLQQKNVVTGATLQKNTQYTRTHKGQQNPDNTLTIDYIKQRNQPRKTIYTQGKDTFNTTYNSQFKRDYSVNYNQASTIKYQSQTEKPQPQVKMPKEAYETTKHRDSEMVVENVSKQRKVLTPWKHKILTKLKALMEYKKFLRDRKR